MHLSDLAEDAPDGWWVYKRPEATQDGVLVRFLYALMARRPQVFDATHIVFNGDTFDFDSVFDWPEGTVKGAREGMPSSAAGAVFKMNRILDGHAPFIAALADFLSEGNRVTFVLGNHDRELCFPEAQEILRARVSAAAPPGRGSQVAGRMVVEPWFVWVPGVLFAEHGQQYDSTCSYRDVLSPFIGPSAANPRELEMSFGSHAARQMLSRMGTFNPYDDSSFLLSFAGYLRHWRDHYLGRRPFFTVYVWSVLKTWFVARGQRRGALNRPTGSPRAYVEYAESKGLELKFVRQLRRLWSPPISDRLGSLFHELWIDRMLVMGGFVAIAIAGFANAKTWPQHAMLVTLIPILLFVLRLLGRGSVALAERGRWGLVAEQIASDLEVPVVVLGHSHRPERRPLRGGGRYYNVGTWAPTADPEEAVRIRRYLVVRPHETRPPRIVFESWKG